MANIYVGSTLWTAVPAWTANTAYVSTSNGGRGDYVRQSATPTIGNERVFRCTTSGTSHATTEPTWNITKNATTTDNTVTWTECTGQEADQASGTWKAPHKLLQNACASTWGAAGDVFYVDENHAESDNAAKTINIPGTFANPCRVICVRSVSGTVPPVSADLKTTASVATTNNNNMTISGVARVRGITFTCGSGANAPIITLGGTTKTYLHFDTCKFVWTASSGASMNIGTGSSSIGCKVIWDNVTVKFAAASQFINMVNYHTFIWKGGSIDNTGTAPTSLFNTALSSSGTTLIDGVDLSFLSTKMFCLAQGNGETYYIKNCKEPAAYSATLGITQTTGANAVVYRYNSGSSTTPYILEKHDALGDQTTETTIVRSTGFSANGTPVAMKLQGVSGAVSYWAPFESTPIPFNVTSAGSTVNLTIYGVWAGGAIPTTQEVWLEIAYMGSSTTPQDTINISTTVADILASATTVAVTDSSTWGGSTTKFKWTVALSSPTPGLVGTGTVTVKTASTNALYIDPKVYQS